MVSHSTIPNTDTELTADQLWQVARDAGHAVVLWRLPDQTDQHLMVHTSGALPTVAVDLEELPVGFIISPFANFDTGGTDPFRAQLLRADAYFVRSDVGWQPANHTAATNALARQARNQTAAQHPVPAGTPIPVTDETDERTRFEAGVAEAIRQVQAGAFRKVVLSRTKSVLFDEEPDVVHLFEKLCGVYPTAFVSAVWLPDRAQTWISATPERLVSVDAEGIFRTLSLAGTQSARQPDGTPRRAKDALWSQKEIEEQALVSRYIIECFKKIRLREYLEEGPKTIQAGNLMHLGSHFTVDTQAVRYPQLGTVMLRLLHPTSAVCGMPREAAFQFIQQHEGYDRELYSGFLGPVNVGRASHLFVHIRCMKIEGQTATLYAGAGLTEDSQPDREWLETEMKCQTLMSVIGL